MRAKASDSGMALVIVLCFILLATGLVVAFFSRSIQGRQLSNSSASQSRVEIFAQGAMEIILGDLREEIIDGSNSIPASSGTFFTPKSAADVMPKLAYSSGTGGMESLIRVSGMLMADGRRQSHPGIVSTTSTSRNGRHLTAARWNKPLLMRPRSETDLTPDLGGAGGGAGAEFIAPSWVLVSRDGNTPSQWEDNLKTSPIGRANNPASVIGRYAFAVYNEGGLLDANVAGYPPVAATTAPAGLGGIPRNQTIYKTGCAYADLTQIGLTTSQINNLVGWRNYASTHVSAPSGLSGHFGGYSFAGARTSADYFGLVNQNPNGFMATGTAFSSDAQSDRRFLSRQQLISFLQNGLGLDLADPVFQNLSMFSRSLNQPSFAPSESRPRVSDSNRYYGNTAFQRDDVVNPVFRKVRVKKDFLRNDNTPARVGEPLVKSRFALNRLSWITCEGPSAGASTAVRQAYIEQGIPAWLLDEGTANNILKYFGLTWLPGPGQNGRGGCWSYMANDLNAVSEINGVPNARIIRVLDRSLASSPGTPIADVANMSAPREANFFELLKAAIHVGSIARGAGGVGQSAMCNDFQAANLARVDFHILQIGANIIDQADPDNYPTRIVFHDGSANHSFIGVEDLPYFYGTSASNIITGMANPHALPGAPAVGGVGTVGGSRLLESGTAVILTVPVIWNPHRDHSNATTVALGPDQLRVSACGNSVLGTGTNWICLQSSGRSIPARGLIWPAGSMDADCGLMRLNAGPAPNTGLVFSNLARLYREPTRLMFRGQPEGSNLEVEPGNLLCAYPESQVSEISLSGASQGSRGPGGSRGLSYIGFLMQTGPLRWVDGATLYTLNTLAWNPAASQCTFSMDFKAGSQWIPYQQRIGLVGGSPVPASRPRWVDNFANNQNVFSWDPRSLRWPMMADTGVMASLKSTGTTSPAADFVLARSVRWDEGIGAGSQSFQCGGVSQDMYLGRTCPLTNGRGYVVDADRILRRPMGAYVANEGRTPGSAGTTIGLPMAWVSNTNTPATNGTNSFNRPLLLQRPFRSVAELGYVFSDTPWRNLDFFTPESGFAALLDLFCISQPRQPQGEEPLVAGKVDLNTRQTAVLKAILVGTNRDELDASLRYLLTDQEAEAIAQALVARTTDLDTPGKGPLSNISELVGRHGSGFDNRAIAPTPKAPYDGFSKDLGIYSNPRAPANLEAALNQVQRFRETALRALSDTGQAGTWNLLIDLVAQVGRYPATARDASQFLVEGEKRYWIHVAIDRQRAEVIDLQLEVVNE